MSTKKYSDFPEYEDYDGEYATFARGRRRISLIRVSERRRTSIAFSLIELMVVIGIIAILLGMLLPALNRSRAASLRVKCLSNLHEIGTGLINYASASGGIYPPYQPYPVYAVTLPADPPKQPAWTQTLKPSFADPSSPVYQCPGFPEEAHRVTYFLSARWLFSKGRFALRQSDVRLSSTFILVGECTRRGAYPPSFGTDADPRDDLDKDDAGLESLLFYGDPDGFTLHPGGNNVLFADGHADTVSSHAPQVVTFNPLEAKSWEDLEGD